MTKRREKREKPRWRERKKEGGRKGESEED